MPGKVKISQRNYDCLATLAIESFREGKETGGYLSGVRKNDTIIVGDIVRAGPNARRGPAVFEPDYAYAG